MVSSNGQMIKIILQRNFKFYIRTKTYFTDFLFPIITLLLLTIGNKTRNAALLITSSYFLPMVLIGTIRSVTVQLIEEKSTRQKEIQKIMGLTQFAYAFGWIFYFLIRIMVIIFFFLLFALPLKDFDNPFMQLNQYEEALSFIMFGLAELSMAYFLSVFFNDPKSGGDLSLFINAIGSCLTQLMQIKYFQQNTWPILVLSLIPPYSYSTLQYIGFYQYTQKLIDSDSTQSTFTYTKQDYFIMLLFDIFLYLILFLYFDQILPNEYGTQKHPLFFFRIRSKKENNQQQQNFSLSLQQPLQQENDEVCSAIYFQPFENHEELPRSVQINNLNKRFGKLQAVDNLSLSLYESQIFTLLGHNGAGKTTTISLLTGLIQKDSGSVLYYGSSIDSKLDDVRKYLGICPQRDVLYDVLDVDEHLNFYGKIKGLQDQQLTKEIDEIVNQCALATQRGKPVKNLSGGNKRKLQLGIALIGGSKVIILDEPTSGMDPISRRKIWDILLKLKSQGKTLILTTHHLDEAEELSERVGIMAKGKLLILGSADFVKQNFGIGYHLKVFHKEEVKNWIEKKEHIKKLVLSNIKRSRYNSQSSDNQLIFQLPFDQIGGFIQVFQKLEQDESLHIELMINSLEEAFINIGIDEEKFLKKTKRMSTLVEDEEKQEEQEIVMKDIPTPECIQHCIELFFY